MASSGHKNISRIDQPSRNTVGWYVRVKFNLDSRVQFFSDRAHGGTDKALLAAIRARNRFERELGKPRTDRVVVGRTRRNKSDVAGVRRRKRTYDSRGKQRTVANSYVVNWSPEPGRPKQVSISISEFGEQEAFRRACALRRRKEREIYGEVVTANWSGRALSRLCGEPRQ